MTTFTVEQSWARIESWLAQHAAVSHGLLRPPALPRDIAAAELRLGVTFPPDLKASLLRHDGVQLQDGTPTLGYYGPLSGVEDIVQSTEFLRDVGADLDEDELDEEERDEHAYWPHERLLITLGIGWQSSDGLFLVSRPGPNHGRVGRYFDEDSPSFTPWPGLRHVLADFAAALDNGTPFNGRTPLGFEGRLIWDDDRPTVPDPLSPLGLAAEATEPLVPPAAEPVPSAPARRAVHRRFHRGADRAGSARAAGCRVRGGHTARGAAGPAGLRARDRRVAQPGAGEAVSRRALGCVPSNGPGRLVR